MEIAILVLEGMEMMISAFVTNALKIAYNVKGLKKTSVYIAILCMVLMEVDVLFAILK